jgi:hypothetical protein
MKFTCPYCSVDYTLESPCFCQPSVQAHAQPVMETRKLPVTEPRLAPQIAMAALLAVRVNRLSQLRVGRA